MRSAADLAAGAVLILLLSIAVVFDLRERRIPNPLVATILVVGIAVTTGFDPVLPGLMRAVAGAGVGLLVWLPGWVLHVMGAGDVKLFSAAGAWLGPIGAVNAAIAAALVGGVLALVWMLAKRGGAQTGRTIWAASVAPRTLIASRSNLASTRDMMPYSLAITAGVIVQLVFPGLVVG